MALFTSVIAYRPDVLADLVEPYDSSLSSEDNKY